jgi:hypothetical protein
LELITYYHKSHRSKSLDDLTKIKTERLLRKFQIDGIAIWTFSKKENHYLSELFLKCAGNEFHSQSSSDNFFKTLEFNLLKMDFLLERHLAEERRWSELSL